MAWTPKKSRPEELLLASAPEAPAAGPEAAATPPAGETGEEDHDSYAEAAPEADDMDVDPRPLDASNAGSQADDTSTVVENSAQPNANAARSGTAVPCADGQESATAVLTPNTTASPPQGPS